MRTEHEEWMRELREGPSGPSPWILPSVMLIVALIALALLHHHT